MFDLLSSFCKEDVFGLMMINIVTSEKKFLKKDCSVL